MSDHQACAAAGLPPPELVTVRGEEVTIAGVECYVAGSGSLCVVVGYDVFGFKVKNTRHNVDELARIIPDSTVVMPDFFRGATASDVQPLTGEAIGKFIQDYGSFEVVKTDLAVLTPALKERGAENFLWLGFCWGGRVALSIAAEPNALGFAACGGIHAALKDDALDLAARVSVPLLFVQARNDPDLRPLQEVLDRDAALAERHLLRTYHDMLHGYCSARGDRSKPRVRSAVSTTIAAVGDFFIEIGVEIGAYGKG